MALCCEFPWYMLEVLDSAASSSFEALPCSISDYCVHLLQLCLFCLTSALQSVPYIYLTMNNWFIILGHGHIKLCASLVVILHMISWICWSTGYIRGGSHPSWHIIWSFLFASLLPCIETSLSTTLFLPWSVRYVLFLSFWTSHQSYICFYWLFSDSFFWVNLSYCFIQFEEYIWFMMLQTACDVEYV